MMLCGRRAFHGKSSIEVLHAILKEDCPEISEQKCEIPPAVVRIVRHCLEKSREDRFQSIADVAFDLEALSAGAERESSAGATVQRRSRRRISIGLAAAAIVLVAAVITWQVKRPGEAWENPLANARIERVTDFPGIETDAAISPDGVHSVPL